MKLRNEDSCIRRYKLNSRVLYLMKLFANATAIMVLLLSFNLSAQEMVLARLHGMHVADICSSVLIEAYERLGITVRIKQFPSTRSLSVSNSGEADGEVVRIKGAEKNYPNLIRVKSKICSTQATAYFKGKAFKLYGWESLKEYKIGYIRGHLYAQKGTEGMDTIEVRTHDSLFEMLDNGRIDIAIAQTADALNIISSKQLHGIIGLEPILVSMNLYHYVHKSHRALLPKIEAIINEMMLEGRLAEIHNRYMDQLNAKILENNSKSQHALKYKHYD